MQATGSPRHNLSQRHYNWLRHETSEWEASGAIPPGTGRLILDRYSVESAERRGMIAMMLIAASLCSVGLLLLIGYNWDNIPRAAKLAIVIGAVAAAYAGSALAYARRWLVAGETLAFFGVLLFGNAIFLVAQILQMHGRDPDAVLWWALGGLATAWLVRSRWTGAMAALLVLFWTMFEGGYSGRYAATFLLVWPLAIAVAYSLAAPIMLRVVAPALTVWAFFSGADAASHSAFWLGGILLIGCALYGMSLWHDEDNPMTEAWEGSGLLTLLVVLIPLTITMIHGEMRSRDANAAAVVIAAAAGVVAVASGMWRSRTTVDRAVLGVAAATIVWMVGSWSGWLGPASRLAIPSTVLFSVLTLAMAVALIRNALTTGEIGELGTGVAFALMLLIVRWVSVVENLFWSGLLMLAAGGGLLLIARLWKQRPREAVEGSRS